MGVRLYPNTTDRAALETLAGVPHGTYDRLDAMTARHEAALVGLSFAERNELEYQQYCERQDDAAIGDLDAFLTFGWGKFREVDGLGTDCAGCIENLDAARRLLRYNGIGADVALANGVHWC